MSDDQFDWDLDLRPVRRRSEGASPRPRRNEETADGVTVVSALLDLRRSIERLAVRLNRIEDALGIGQTGATDSATLRLRAARAAAVPIPMRALRVTSDSDEEQAAP